MPRFMVLSKSTSVAPEALAAVRDALEKVAA